jgi:hypothetical protein
MRYEIIQTREFTRKAILARLSQEDIREIENQIVAEPTAFPVMQGTGGLRKMRFAPAAKGAGKSGGIRVCYFVIEPARHLWLVTLFSKNEKDNLNAQEKAAIARLISVLKKAATSTPEEK